ncbi:hypothetical protein F4604DRAFT_1912878 [Suillus subluteus]|nr:hypothetical protein F4604DRAFT_1912878 [Suillus subluteus]
MNLWRRKVTKEDRSKVGASTPAVFGGFGFGADANSVSSKIFEKSSPPSPQPNGDASTSRSTPKSVFGSATSSNTLTPAESPVVFGSAQLGAFTFGNGSTKPADSAKPSPRAPPSSDATPLLSFHLGRRKTLR